MSAKFSINHHIRHSLGSLKNTTDFQRQVVYDYHVHAYPDETPLPVDQCNRILGRLDYEWGVTTIGLYPDKWPTADGAGWPMGAYKAAIQLSPELRMPSYLAHEHAHGVVECYRVYHSTNELNDHGHGPVWSGVFAYNMSILLDTSIDIIRGNMIEYGIKVLKTESIIKFNSVFTQKLESVNE